MKNIFIFVCGAVCGLLLMSQLAQAGGGTYDNGTYNFPSILNIGTSTSWTANTNVVHVVVKEPTGNGTTATTTVMIGDSATTTSRSSIQMNNVTGAPQCVFLVGSVLTVTPGRCL